MKERTYNLKQGVTEKFKASVVEDDYIPMHRSHGDSYTFQFEGRELTGAVQRSWKYLTLIAASDGEFYIEDTRQPENKQIRQLGDSDRCVHCGHFFCTSDCPNYTSEEAYKMSKKNTINIHDVLSIQPGTDDDPSWLNDIVECVVLNVKEAKGKGPVKATLTSAEDDGDKITGIFWKRDYDDVAKWEGKLVRMEGQMIRSQYKPEKGPKIQQLAVMAKCDVEVVGESAHSDRPLPHKASSDRDTPKDAPKRQETGNGAHPVTARRAVFEKFRLLGLVNTAYSAMKEEYNLPEMTGGELSTFSTGVGISLMRGESLPDSLFADVKQPSGGMKQSDLDKQPDADWGDDDQGAPGDRTAKPQSTEKLSSWKSFVHPKTKKVLGELDEEALLKYSRWAAGLEEAPEDKDGKLFYANIKMMMAEKGWSVSTKLLMNSLMLDSRYSNEYSDDDINGYCQAELDKPIDDLDDEEAAEAVANYDDFVDGIIKFAKKPKKAGKKAKAEMPE